MKIKAPEVCAISSNGIWTQRNRVQGVFLRRHNLEVNLDSVRDVIDSNNVCLSPSDWLLLIEGRRRYTTPENLYLDHVIDKHDIASCDPIVAPFTGGIADVASVEKMIAALSVLVMEYLDFVDQNDTQLNEVQLREFLDRTVHLIAESFAVSSKTLQSSFLKLKWNKPAFWDEVDQLQTKRQKLIDESNRQSRSKLVGILDENDMQDIFIMAGITHKPVFEV